MSQAPLIPWANGGNYPAGSKPWSATPLCVLPPQNYFTPDVPIAAQLVNYELNQLALAINALSAQSASVGVNWGAEFGTTGFAAVNQEAMAWSPLNSKWMLLSVTTGGTPLIEVWETYGLDGAASAAWTQLGSNFLTTNGWLYSTVSPDPSNVAVPWAAGTDNVATHNHCIIASYVSGSWSTGSITAAGYFYGIESAVIGTAVCFAVAGTGAGDSQILSRNTGGLNLSFNTGLTMAVGSTWCMRSNGSQIVAIPSSLSLYTVFYSSDGQTWHTSSSLAGLLAAGNTVVGLAWGADALGPCWLAAIQSGSGQPFWARSGDGITWTIQAGGVSTNMTVTDMAACGSLFVCTLADASSGGPSGQIFSVDGGITWYFSQATFTSNATTGTAGYTRNRVISSNIGFAAFNTLWARFSLLQGLPPANL